MKLTEDRLNETGLDGGIYGLTDDEINETVEATIANQMATTTEVKSCLWEICT